MRVLLSGFGDISGAFAMPLSKGVLPGSACSYGQGAARVGADSGLHAARGIYPSSLVWLSQHLPTVLDTESELST